MSISTLRLSAKIRIQVDSQATQVWGRKNRGIVARLPPSPQARTGITQLASVKLYPRRVTTRASRTLEDASCIPFVITTQREHHTVEKLLRALLG